MADAILALGVLLVAIAVGALAGIWWGVLFVGVVLIVYAVVDAREALVAPPADPAAPRDTLERVQAP